MNKTEVFVIGCYPNTEEKIKILEDTIKKIKLTNLPIIIVSHYFIPKHIFDQVDYIIYDRQNTISDWRLNYWTIYPKFLKIVGKTEGMGYHSVACLTSIMNAVLYCREKYDIIHFVESDIDFKVDEYLNTARFILENKMFYAYDYEVGRTNLGLSYSLNGIWTGLMSFYSNWYYLNMLDIRTWDEYTYIADNVNERSDYILEHWFYYTMKSRNLLKDIVVEDSFTRDKIVINKNLTDTGKTDNKSKILVSELDDKENIILFFINSLKEKTNFEIKFGDKSIEREILSGQIHYMILPKSIGRLETTLGNIHKIFNVSMDKTFSETRFRFYDERVKCVQWFPEDDCNFIEDGEKT